MPHIIKVRCTGAGKHVNDVDLDKVLTPTPMVRGGHTAATLRKIPKRLVLPCQQGTEGPSQSHARDDGKAPVPAVA